METYRQLKMGLFGLIVVAVCAIFYASLREATRPGPLAVVMSADGQLMVGLAGHIVTLNSAGHVIAKTALKTLGMEGPVEDMQALSDGSLLIGDRGSEHIFQCQANLTQCVPLSKDRWGPYFKFYAIEDEHKILIAETGHHKVVMLNISSGKVTPLLGKEANLTFPNDIIPAKSGGYWLTDTGNSRLLRFRAHGAHAGEILQTLNFKSPVLHEKRTQPILLRSVGEHDWAVVRDSGIQRTDIVTLSKDEKPVVLLADAKLKHPNDLLLMGDTVLVADNGTHRLLVLSLDGHFLRTFGDASFDQQLDDEIAHIEFAKLLKYGFIGLTLVLLAGALFVEHLEKRQHNQIQAQEAVRYPVWLVPDQRFKTVIRVSLIILVVLTAFMAISFWEVKRSHALLSILMIVPLPLLYAPMIRMWKTKIGITEDSVTLVDHHGQRVTANFRELQHSPTALMLNNVIVFVGRNGILFGKAYLRNVVPHLDPANKLSDWELSRKMIRQQADLYLALVLALFCVFAAVLVVIG